MIGLTLGTGVGGVLAIDGRVHQGHDAAHVEDDVDTLVVTSALWPDNPELIEAIEKAIASKP